MSEKVFVQNMRGEPLMPTNPAKARHLLDDGKAKVVDREPFTIRLEHPTGENKQEVILGVDAGYSTVGFSAVTGEEELICGELDLRGDVSKKLSRRAGYRRSRRSRNTRYRQPRFDNRKKGDGWLAPSIDHKMKDHIQLVRKLKSILPVTRVVVEVATFDTQKMQNPEISGVEYQEGTLKGYHVKEYLLEKFNYTCVYCGKADVPLEVDHIVPKSRGGSDRVNNLAISCAECNQEKDNRTAEEFGHPEVQEKAEKTLKSAAFMNIVRWKIVDELDCNHTYGYRTKKKRLDLGLKKSDDNDAFVIAGGENQERTEPYRVIQRRRNNRSLQINRKGYGRSVRREHYKFQPGDLVRADGVLHRVKGTHCYGKRVVVYTRDGNRKSLKATSLKLIKYGKGLHWQEKTRRNSSPTESEIRKKPPCDN